MRDPDGAIEFESHRVIRRLRAPLTDAHFLHSATAQIWVQERRLVDFEFVDAVTVQAPRLAFVTHPSEWCDAQLYDAAELTLGLAGSAVEAGYELKDASAWNVLFDGTQALLCDLLSIVPLTQRSWWAFGQFARHFVLPLLVARHRGMPASQTFLIRRDGITPELASQLLGWRRYDPRYFPLLARSHLDQQHRLVAAPTPATAELDDLRRFRAGLHASAAWMLRGAVPRPATRRLRPGWADYERSRAHYSEAALTAKRQTVERWLAEIKPLWALDLGCNSGEFSSLALAGGASVVAVDADHDAVQDLYRRHRAQPRIYPVLTAIDDLRGGRGWASAELPSLLDRMLDRRFDVVLALAIVHHLAVACSVPLLEIARLLHRLTQRWLIVELIDHDDRQFQLLCGVHHRSAEGLGALAQLDALRAVGFTDRSCVDLPGGGRRLWLLEREVV